MAAARKAKPIRVLKEVTPRALPLQEIDKSKLKADFDAWPDLAREAWSNAVVPQIGTDFRSVIVTGMGGSGISGDLLSDLVNEQGSTVRIQTVKDYHLPNWADENTIVVGMSCSGNTEETLSVLSEARRKGLQGFTFGSGGLIEDFSRTRWNYKFTKTRMLKVPRTSFPGLFFPVLKFFIENGILQFTEEEILGAIAELTNIREKSGKETGSSNPSLVLAGKVAEGLRYPVIYSSARTRAVGLRFRQSLNENAKLHAFNGEIPELCHNEVVGWDASSDDESASRGSQKERKKSTEYIVVATRLRQDDPPEIRTRFEVVKAIVEKQGGEFLEAPYSGSPYLTRIISMLYSLDYVTYYCSILRGIDPTKTPSIDYLKKEISRKLDYTKKLL